MRELIEEYVIAAYWGKPDREKYLPRVVGRRKDGGLVVEIEPSPGVLRRLLFAPGIVKSLYARGRRMARVEIDEKKQALRMVKR